MQQGLAHGGACKHRASEHEPIMGQVKVDGRTISRSTLAGAWPPALARHVLRAAELALRRPRASAALVASASEETGEPEVHEVAEQEDLEHE
eukprot:9440925-Alexandrium_andersonii.AAC.1